MNTFKPHPWYLRIYYKFRLFLNHIRYPQSIWYGGSIKREHALDMVGKGWSKLINNIYDAKPRRTKIIDVKEKYASLRVYTTYSPEWFDDLIDYYDHESETICEYCGKPGKVRLDRGWYKTLCDDCDKPDESFVGDSDHEHDDRIL